MDKFPPRNFALALPNNSDLLGGNSWQPQQSSRSTFRDARYQQILVMNALDNSPSQHTNNGWAELSTGLPTLVKEVRGHPALQRSVQFATCAIGHQRSTECVVPYTPATEFQVPDVQQTTYGSPILELASLAIAYAAQHEEILGSEHDLDIAWNCVFLMTDGHATDQDRLPTFEDANRLAIERKVDVVILATGEGPNLPLLTAMSQPGKRPIEMKSVDRWTAFFQDLYASLHRASQGTLGRNIVIADTRLRLLR